MIFQKVVKGIADLAAHDAELMVLQTGILSNWWRKKKVISNPEIQQELTESNLILHLNNYNQPLPIGHRSLHLGKTYGEVSAFISTSAGVIQRDKFKKVNIIYPSFLTSLKFATKNFKTSGYIFYAYLMVLGKKSVALQGFSEEVRELHVFNDFMPYYQQGEITAKVSIPSVNIEKAELYDGKKAIAELRKGTTPTPISTIINPNYLAPDLFSNIREII